MNKEDIKEVFTQLLEDGKKEGQIAAYSITDSDTDTITIVIKPTKEVEDNIDTITT